MPEADSLPEASVEEDGGVRCESETVRAILGQLSEETQNIFTLHFDEGMTHPEIATKTGLPLGTIKTRLRRGLIEIRDKLRQLDGANSTTQKSS